MWSFAVLLWELVTREVPFADLSHMEIGMKVSKDGNVFFYFRLFLKLYLSSCPRSCSGGPGRSAANNPSWDFTSHL